MSEKDSKSKEEMLIQMYIKKWITKTQYFETLKRIENGKNTK